MIDWQARLLSAMPAGVSEALVARIRLLVRAATLLDIPIVVTCQYPSGLGPLSPEVMALLPDTTVQIEKVSFSCCAEPTWQTVLGDGRDHVVLAGVETHICVLQTACDLKTRGQMPFVVGDACMSRRVADHSEGLARLRAEGVQVAQTESVVFEWLRSADHRYFRELARLVKDIPLTA